jgi:hypothetical protein
MWRYIMTSRISTLQKYVFFTSNKIDVYTSDLASIEIDRP